MTEKSLTNKDCAKILYDLYKGVYDKYTRNPLIPMEITENQRKRFSDCFITDEEIWAYSNKLIYLSDEPFLARIDTLREAYVAKRSFTLAVFMVAYQICEKPEEKVFYNSELDEFALEKKLFYGIANTKEELDCWFWIENQAIRMEDAEKIVENVTKFFEQSRNC